MNVFEQKIADSQEHSLWPLAFACAYCISYENGQELNAILILRVLEAHFDPPYAPTAELDRLGMPIAANADSFTCDMNPEKEP